MEPRDRIANQLPLERLWADSGELEARRGPQLDRNAIAELLRTGSIRFVIAEAGRNLEWIPEPERFTFWKRVAMPHLSETDHIDLSIFPDQKAFTASLWTVPGGQPPIVLLEVHH